MGWVQREPCGCRWQATAVRNRGQLVGMRRVGATAGSVASCRAVRYVVYREECGGERCGGGRGARADGVRLTQRRPWTSRQQRDKAAGATSGPGPALTAVDGAWRAAKQRHAGSGERRVRDVSALGAVIVGGRVSERG